MDRAHRLGEPVRQSMIGRQSADKEKARTLGLSMPDFRPLQPCHPAADPVHVLPAAHRSDSTAI
jgi:hypothetical protein